ncbi:universal stress protein [Lentzea sp. NPDC051213]|uniref:universal stress protein n=1 Tax=Lentzea sp. NPDC051213 TaxID=3364126 RepID=UPI0037AE1C86
MKSRVIVVGVDGSAAGRAALRWALEEAGRGDATVQAMMARLRRRALVAVGPSGVHPCTELPSGRHPAHELHALIVETRAELPGAPETAEITVVGDTSAALIQASRRADLLVIGATEAFQGSVVADCVQHAACPVVVIPPGVARASSV